MLFPKGMKKRIALGLLSLGIVCFALAFDGGSFAARIGTTPQTLSRVIAASKNASAQDVLMTEPEDGMENIKARIDGAKTSVDLVMYELADPQVEQALAAAQARGVAVRVLLNRGYYAKQESTNADSYKALIALGVPARATPTRFALTHQKTLIIDGSEAIIMTFNLDPKYYATGRDFGVLDTDAADVAAIEKTFTADWNDTEISAPTGSDLVWSPGSEKTMLALIEGATSTLEIYNEEMADPQIVDALTAAAKRGVQVDVVMTYASNWAKPLATLAAAGVHVHLFNTSAPLYIHAKMILVDNAYAFLGSENFSTGSLNANRELGLIIANPAIVSSLETTFQKDFAHAKAFQ